MKTLLCLVVLAAAMAVKAQNTVALQSYAANLGGYADGTSGWTFQPLTNVSVTALGAFDYIVTNQGPISVGLWAADGTLLASNTVSTNSVLVGQAWYKARYEPIDPILLATNQTYYLGAFSPAGFLIINAFGPGEGLGYVTMAPEIELGTADYSSNFLFSFPGTTGGAPGSAILAPNFEFQDGILPPVLNIACTSNDVLISWSATYTGLTLQENSDLTTTNWMAVTNSINVVGGENQVFISPPAGNNFYRLTSQ